MFCSCNSIHFMSALDLFSVVFGEQDCLEAEWLESMSKTFIEFAHELDPNGQNGHI